MGRDVQVRYTKYDGSLHWHFVMEELGRDEHGWWLGGREGTVLQRGSEPTIEARHDFVLLAPPQGWWTACFNADPHEVDVYVDLTSVPECTDDAVTMIDLDLDVVRRRDGSVYLDDEDEFIEHQAKYGYPLDVVESVTKTAVELIEAVTAGTEPFGESGRQWLSRLAATR
jgi:protein associated with RNAse G/E